VFVVVVFIDYGLIVGYIGLYCCNIGKLVLFTADFLNRSCTYLILLLIFDFFYYCFCIFYLNISYFIFFLSTLFPYIFFKSSYTVVTVTIEAD
jgi:hypothetical protein